MNIKTMRPFKLTPDDVPELTALERLCFSRSWTEEQFLLGMGRGVLHVFGFKDRARLIAYLSFYHVGPDMEILNLAVHPDYRRKGLGENLLRRVLAACVELGIRQVRLEVRLNNTAALNLYSKVGFSRVGVRKNYYPDTGEDAVLMDKQLFAPLKNH